MKKLSLLLFFFTICAIVFFVFKNEKYVSIANDSTSVIKNQKFDRPAEFEKFHQMIRAHKGDSISKYPVNNNYKEYQKAKRQIKGLNKSTPDLDWVSRGPGNVGGRTRAIVIDDRDSTFNTWFLGAVAGGIWKTDDAGQTWTNLTADLPNLSISWLAQGNNPEIMYASTGNAFVSRGTNGAGVLKSVDGGESWFYLSATQTDQFVNIFRLSINPENDDDLVVSTLGRREFGFTDNTSRILRSTDGGQNWALVLEKDGGRIQQVIHGDADNVYAAVNGEGILKSEDKGATWNQVWTPPGNRFGRLEIAAINSILYISLEDAILDASNEIQDVDRIYKSSDFGQSWFEVLRSNGELFGSWLGGQGWFDNTITLLKENPNEVYVAGQSAIIKVVTTSNDNGSFYPSDLTVLTDGYGNFGSESTGSKGVHVDHHNLIAKVDPITNEVFILNSNDGGVSFSRNGGDSFLQTGDLFNVAFGGGGDPSFEFLSGYITSQFYGVDKMNGGDRYVGGTQDNGSWVSPQDPDDQSQWSHAPSGDGFEAAWHYGDSNLVLESSQFNNIYRSEDGGESWQNAGVPGGNGPFITRIENSKLNPDLVLVSASEGLVRSTDFGLNWEVIEMPLNWSFNGSTGPPIEISLSSPNVVWSGNAMNETDALCISLNGGQNFKEVETEGIETGRITGIESHPENPGGAYVLFSQPESAKIWKTEDFGDSWTDITEFDETTGISGNGYPDVATYSLLVMPYNTEIIWAGTDIGIIESLNGGQSWNILESDFPAAPVWSMRIVNDEIVVGTHGRGLWTVTLSELDGYEPTEALFPVVNLDRNFGSLVSGVIELSSEYDSAKIEFFNPDSVLLFEKFVNEILVDSNYRISYDAVNDIPKGRFTNIDVNVTVYRSGSSLPIGSQAEVFPLIDEAVFEYANDFEEMILEDDFAKRDMLVESVSGISSTGLSHVHYYENNSNLLSVLRQPIIIAEDSRISFDEIVLVEPGSSSNPDSPQFWDYVELEGTADRGQTWIRIERYDSSTEQLWRNAFDSGESGNESLIINKQHDLANFFNVSDTIFLRFSLFSDGFVTGWGWFVDNINVEGGSTGLKPASLDDNVDISIFPNPIHGSGFTIEYQSDLALDDFELKIMNTEGRQMPFTYQENNKRQIIYMKGKWASGNYFVQIKSDAGYTVKKIVVLDL